MPRPVEIQSPTGTIDAFISPKSLGVGFYRPSEGLLKHSELLLWSEPENCSINDTKWTVFRGEKCLAYQKRAGHITHDGDQMAVFSSDGVKIAYIQDGKTDIYREGVKEPVACLAPIAWSAEDEIIIGQLLQETSEAPMDISAVQAVFQNVAALAPFLLQSSPVAH